MKLLEKDAPFEFSEDYMNAFLSLKKKLVEAPIIVFLDWSLPFEMWTQVIMQLGEYWGNNVITISIRFTTQARL